MLREQKVRYDPKLVVDHVSAQGPYVTDIRGVMLQARIGLLKSAGHFEQYLAHLPVRYQDAVLNALASSWVPVEAGIAHFEALESMGLSDAQLARIAEPHGASLFHSLFATLIRGVARQAGAEGVWAAVKQADRIWSRMYLGGACKVMQVGPKDATIEISGLPYAQLRSYRVTYCGFLRGMFGVVTKTCVIKIALEPEPRSDRLAVSASWV
jgi:hypothetical protein